MFPIPGQTSATSGCHDITAYPAKGIAAGACMGEGVILDVSDLTDPVVVESVTDPTSRSGTRPRSTTTPRPSCSPTSWAAGEARPATRLSARRRAPTPSTRWAPIGQLTFRSYFKIPKTNDNTENRVAHNGSLIPVDGHDLMVQAWYQGGISVVDFTDPANPVEIGWWERGPLSKEQLVLGGSWSAYWYNGKIYSSDIQKSFDVLQIADSRVASARSNWTGVLNVQTQQPYGG